MSGIIWNHRQGLSQKEKETILKTLGLHYWFESSTNACLMVEVKEIMQWIRDALLTNEPTWHRSGDTTVIWIRWRKDRKVSDGQLCVIARGHIYAKYIYKQDIRGLRRKLRKLNLSVEAK